MSIQERLSDSAAEQAPPLWKYFEMPVVDEFETGERARIETSLREVESMGFYGDSTIETALSRKRLSKIDYDNPATKELIARIPGVEHWLALVPTPRALSPLYNPNVEKLPGGHVVGNELRTWMIEIADARGLRYRSSMVSDLLVDHATHSERSSEPQKWLSIASGAAQPILKAAREVAEVNGEAPHMTLVDLSSEALADAKELAKQCGVEEHLQIERMNVLRRQGLHAPIKMGEIALHKVFNRSDRAKLSRERLELNGYDVVEAVGILEYMKPEDWAYRYNGVVNLKTVQAGARTFLKNSYKLVKPGGHLLVGNMLTSHPQLGFTLNTIQWPHVQPRSVDEMMQLFDEAGLSATREVFVPSDESARVYALYRVHKPEEGL